MFQDKKIVCVIPARLRSTRFPEKMLASLCGKPLIERTWEAALLVPHFDRVVLAVDDERVARVVEGFQGEYFMTSVSCPSGTDRLVELVTKGQIDGDIFVNWQGDEPFITKTIVEDLLMTCASPFVDIWTLKSRMREEDAHNPHICKVVCSAQNRALYFSRYPIPYMRDEGGTRTLWKHIGMYAYTKKTLQSLQGLSACMIEQAEQLEQLRFLYEGFVMHVQETKEEVFGIDIPEHLERAEALLQTMRGVYVHGV